jgi:hypothetical protein
VTLHISINPNLLEKKVGLAVNFEVLQIPNSERNFAGIATPISWPIAIRAT